MTDREILLNLIYDLTLGDHMGDVSNYVNKALKDMGLEIEWDEWEDLREQLEELV